ncbi:MAG: metal ABC transporter permease, partial [Pseudomonadales bacterium]
MRRALFGGIALACSAGPLGVFLILRRMSLIGDAIAHGILPGTALAFWLFGLSLPALTIGGLIAGLSMAGLSAWISRRTGLREDASLAALYPISLASGVLLLGLGGRKLDLIHLLFGSALAVDTTTLNGMLGTSVLSLLLLVLIYRALALDSLDPLFLRSVSHFGALAHGVFLTLVVLNLVIGFQAIGALMVVGLMILPAAAARFWSRQLPVLLMLAALFGA